MQLEARAIAGLRTSADGTIAWCSVTAADLAAAGAALGEARDLIEIPESLAGVEIAAVFRELPETAGTRVSLRSAGPFRVNDFAERYGGGGHPKAAGLRVPETLADAERQVIEDLTRELSKSKNVNTCGEST